MRSSAARKVRSASGSAARRGRHPSVWEPGRSVRPSTSQRCHGIVSAPVSGTARRSASKPTTVGPSTSASSVPTSSRNRPWCRREMANQRPNASPIVSTSGTGSARRTVAHGGLVGSKAVGTLAEPKDEFVVADPVPVRGRPVPATQHLEVDGGGAMVCAEELDDVASDWATCALGVTAVGPVGRCR